MSEICMANEWGAAPRRSLPRADDPMRQYASRCAGINHITYTYAMFMIPIVAAALMGLATLWSITTGRISGRGGGTVTRRSHPIFFWFFILLMLAFTTFLLVGAFILILRR